MTDTSRSEAATLRTLIQRAKSSNAIAQAWIGELEGIAKRLEGDPPSKFEQSIRFALFALLDSVRRGESNNWYVTDAEVFVWAMDELDRLTR